MGESFICKPHIAYNDFFKDDHFTFSQIKKMKDKANVSSIKCIVKDFFEFKVKKETSKYYGQTMIKATLEDKSGEQCSCTIFPDRWKLLQERIAQINSKSSFSEGLAVHFSANVNIYEDNVGIVFDKLFNLSMAPKLPEDLKAKKISLKEAKNNLDIQITNNLIEQIEDILYDEGLIDLDCENEDN
jgi:hypothetical protein